MDAQIGIGIIGANADRGWARSSHLPALIPCRNGQRARLVAVATSRAESADRTAEALQVAAYADYHALIADPRVDVVVVSVRLPMHREIVAAALQAGKHVFCEWPLGKTPEEAEELAALAREKGVHTMIGLQARASPAIRRAAELIAAGYVGELLSVSVLSSGLGWGGAIDEGNAYLFDRANGATLLTITGGHLLDALARIVGPLNEISATLATMRERIAVVSEADLARYRAFEAGVVFEPEPASATAILASRRLYATSPDQVMVQGRLKGAAPFSLHLRGGLLRGSGLLVEIVGTRGELRLQGPAGVIQLVPLSISGAQDGCKVFEPIGVSEAAGPEADRSPPIVDNIRRLYDQFALDIQTGARTVADFDHAARHQCFLRLIETAAQSGQRLAVPD